MTLFLSHAHIDQDVAEVVASVLEDAFGGLVRIFRSSDSEGSIEIGDSIKETIKASLAECVAAISLLSHSSVARPWINIEFGALWMLDITIIPVCFPNMRISDLPFHFADAKICRLSEENDCTALVSRVNGFVHDQFPFNLKKKDIARHGRALHKRVSEVIRRRGRESVDEPSLPDRTTVWVLGSYSDLTVHQEKITRSLVEILGDGLVSRGIRLISGESGMLIDLAKSYRKAAIASTDPMPSSIMLYGKLRQRAGQKLFADTIGFTPDLAIVIGGGVARGRVNEEVELAMNAGIPILPVPATGGAAAQIQLTANRVDDLFGLLGAPPEAVDVGDLAGVLLRAIERYRKHS